MLQRTIISGLAFKASKTNCQRLLLKCRTGFPHSTISIQPRCSTLLCSSHSTRKGTVKVVEKQFQHAQPFPYHYYSTISRLEFEKIGEETLEALCERCEELGDLESAPPEFDVSYAAGVLTIQLGVHGTYVINKQSPNMQIWLSSPVSGPKRYDYNGKGWFYSHDNSNLHQLLDTELRKVFGIETCFTKCSYGTDS